ncbi:MAG: DUF3352 domain-containing protein [Planctomycetota bacterium]|nr:MAG: DUF3352 domain-containing protein [Planctomycetota bacterium]
MARSFMRILSVAIPATVFLCGSGVSGADRQAYDLLPANTQAAVWVRDGEELVDRWHQTQLAKLAADDAVAPFFETRKNEIRDRLMQAGWRLKIQPEDLADYATGQIALAWTTKQDAPLKPYATILLADVDDDPPTNARMMAEFEKQLASDKTSKKTEQYQGIAITQYRLPPRPGELMQQDSYFAIVHGLLLISDDEAMIRDLIDRALNPEQSRASALSSDEAFVESRRLAGIDQRGQIEYFVRPLGFARVIRAMSGNRSKSSSDIIAILENQGFAAIQAVAGQLVLGSERTDIEHSGFVYAKHPLPKSAAVLDFPNEVPKHLPSFVTERIATFVATSWNAQDAFWKIEGLVDDFAGTRGVFDEMIQGLKHDPDGPQIDIAVDVIPNLSNDIFALTDNKPGPADVDSRRNLIAIRVKDTAKMQKVLDDAMKIEPDAERVEINGHHIWKVVHREDASVEDLGDFSEFGDFGDFEAPGEEEAQEPEPWLSSFALAVHGGYLMFSSHMEMIEEAIEQMDTSPVSPLLSHTDYQRARSALHEIFGDPDACAWQVVRSDLAYRVQYELFRHGKLRESQSMLATLLDRLLKDEEVREKNQVIEGSDLPEFDYIKKFLQPGATIVRTTPHGWSFGSVLLSPKYQVATELKEAAIDTARISDSTVESKR